MKDKNNINDLINTKANEEKIENNISPKVSIIVPIYNVEKYLRQCLDSIVNQTLKDIEIILVNDGSTDSCPSICDEYASKDKRIIVIHKENKGLGAAYNTGLDIAKGEYIGFVESDDFIELNMYEELYERAVQSGVDICLGSFYIYHGKTNSVVKTYSTPYFLIQKDEIFSFDKHTELLTLHSSVWSKLYKRQSLGHLRFPVYGKKSYYVDFCYIVAAYLNAKSISRIDSYIYNYRTDNTNSSSSNNKNDVELLDIIPAIKKAKEFARKYNAYDLIKEELYFSSILTSFRFFANIKIEYKKTFFEGMKEFLQDLKEDSKFTYKYFKKDSVIFRYIGDSKRYFYMKEFIHSVLANDYNKALATTVYLKDSAVYRIQNQLSYKIGKVLVQGEKNINGLLQIPTEIIKAIKEFKEYRRSIKNIQLIKIENCKDYSDALKAKNYLSYKIGNELVKSFKQWYIGRFLLLPFSLFKIYKKHSRVYTDQETINKTILSKLNIIEDKINNIKTDILASNLHPKIFTPYKRVHENQDIVIVGTGPSVKYYVNKPIKNAIHIGLNRAFLLENINFDYYFVSDSFVPEGNDALREFIVKHPQCKVFLGMLPDKTLDNDRHFRLEANMYHYENVSPFIIQSKYNFTWAYNIENEAFMNANIAISALQFICYTNPKNIYFVGCDASSGHFYNNDAYAHMEFPNEIVRIWIKAKAMIKKYYPNINLISINPVNLKNLFDEDIYTVDKSLLPNSPESNFWRA